MSTVTVTRSGKVALLRLENPPANAISRRVVKDLAEALEKLERDAARALVLLAAGERFFSAGLDLILLHDLDRAAIEVFSKDFIGVLLKLFRFPGPVVAAVNGHAVAGGAILALTADRRILTRGDQLLGLNEVQVGLPLPGPLFEVVRSALGRREASEVLLEGKNYGVDDALRIGLAHEVVEREELELRALAVAEKLSRIPQSAYRRMKEMLHADAEERIARKGAADPFVDIWFEPETRRAMTKARDKLLAKKAKN